MRNLRILIALLAAFAPTLRKLLTQHSDTLASAMQ